MIRKSLWSRRLGLLLVAGLALVQGGSLVVAAGFAAALP